MAEQSVPGEEIIIYELKKKKVTVRTTGKKKRGAQDYQGRTERGTSPVKGGTISCIESLALIRKKNRGGSILNTASGSKRLMASHQRYSAKRKGSPAI